MDKSSNGGGRVVVIILVIVVVLGGLGGGWYWLQYKPAQEAKEKARLEQIAKKEAEQKRKELAAQQKAQYEKLIENADAEFNLGNWEAAYSLYSDASSLLPDQQYPQDQLTLVNAKLDEIAALAAGVPGIVETISAATGRFYIIVSSSIDDDLAMDHADKLAQEGNAVKIIEHDTDTIVYYRISVADYDVRDQAMTASASFGTNVNEAWVLQY
ncbi:MAG: hypothetical protein KI790_16910 [Cyclobacteriaceae bacterium]|nr:hypothetical protein [Cyclobacteriaceae bacterium HetDA_MAG_MS6]